MYKRRKKEWYRKHNRKVKNRKKTVPLAEILDFLAERYQTKNFKFSEVMNEKHRSCIIT